MVRDDRGQLYTIEGFAAALIMLATTYLVLNATSVYTGGDTHISDMQLETLGNDALKMMDTAPNTSVETPLHNIIENLNSENRLTFKNLFLNYTNASGSGPVHDIQFNATFTCRNVSGSNPPTKTIPIVSSRERAGGEHPVRATRWIIVSGLACDNADIPRAVLVEVLLWRD